MQVTSTTEKNFQPITIQLIIESEEEARALYAIFNHTTNTDLLRSAGYLFSADIREAIGEQYGVYSEQITSTYSYNDWYK